MCCPAWRRGSRPAPRITPRSVCAEQLTRQVPHARRLLQQVMRAEGPGAGGGEASGMDGFLGGMMQQFLCKEVLYRPLKARILSGSAVSHRCIPVGFGV